MTTMNRALRVSACAAVAALLTACGTPQQVRELRHAVLRPAAGGGHCQRPRIEGEVAAA